MLVALLPLAAVNLTLSREVESQLFDAPYPPTCGQCEAACAPAGTAPGQGHYDVHRVERQDREGQLACRRAVQHLQRLQALDPAAGRVGAAERQLERGMEGRDGPAERVGAVRLGRAAPRGGR